jgi:hypothetical protein
MTIDASQNHVNGRIYAEDEDESRALSKLMEIGKMLKRAAPDQFARVLEREWRNHIVDALCAGNITPDQVRGHLILAASGRASCLGVLDEFLAREFPAPRSIDEARIALSFTDAAYRIGDEPEELIKRLLPKDGVTMIGGQSGAGKTFVLVAMTLALVTGQPFLGYPVRERVGVIIVAAEGAGTISARFEAARRYAGIAEPLEKLPIGIIRRPPDLDTPEAVRQLIGDVKILAAEMQRKYGVRVGVLAIDTIASAFSIVNENDNSEAAAICKQMSGMSAELQMAVIPVHHFGKAQEQGLRGASAWRANVDHAISVTAERDAVTGTVTARALNVMKSRIGEEGPLCAFGLKPQTLGQNRYGEDIITCAIENSGPAPTKESKKLPNARSDRQFNKAFDDVVIARGKDKRVRGDGPIRRMVPVEDVRKEFMRRYISGSPDGRGSKARMAWKRALNRALDGGAFSAEVDPKTDIEMIWDLMDMLPFEDGIPSCETASHPSQM